MPFLCMDRLLWVDLPIPRWIDVVKVVFLFCPDPWGQPFSFSPLSMVGAVGLSPVAFMMLSCVPSLCTVLSVFIIKWC